MLQELQQLQLTALKTAYQFLDASYEETDNISADITRLHANLCQLVRSNQENIQIAAANSDTIHPFLTAHRNVQGISYFTLGAITGDLALMEIALKRMTSYLQELNAAAAQAQLLFQENLDNFELFEAASRKATRYRYHLEEAEFYAALFNQAGVISFLHEKNIALFNQYTMRELTSLQIACVLGHADTVKATLTTQPSVGFLKIEGAPDQQPAYELAKTHHQQACIQLFESHPQFTWELKEKAFKDKNQAELFRLLDIDPTGNPFITSFVNQGFKSTYSLLKNAFALEAKDHTYQTFWQALLQKFDTYPNEVILNTLFITMTTFKNESEIASELLLRFTNVFDDKGQLETDYRSVKNLSFDGLYASATIFAKFQVALRECQPKTICFVYNRAISQAKALEFYNLKDEYIAPLVAAILTNTNLIACNLETTLAYRPLASLVGLVVKRNQAMQAIKSEVRKEKMYNDYVTIINTAIDNIQADANIVNKHELTHIQPLSKAYSLTEQCAFFIANKMTVSSQQMQILPTELQEFVADSVVSTNKPTV